MNEFTEEENREWEKKVVTIAKQPRLFVADQVFKVEHDRHKFALITVEKNIVTVYATTRFSFAMKKIIEDIRKQFPDAENKSLYVVQTNKFLALSHFQ